MGTGSSLTRQKLGEGRGQARLQRKLQIPHFHIPGRHGNTGSDQRPARSSVPSAVSLGAGKRPSTYLASPVTESPEQPWEGGQGTALRIMPTLGCGK